MVHSSLPGYVGGPSPPVYMPPCPPFVGSPASLRRAHRLPRWSHAARKRGPGCGKCTFDRGSTGGWEASFGPQERVLSARFCEKGKVYIGIMACFERFELKCTILTPQGK